MKWLKRLLCTHKADLQRQDICVCKHCWHEFEILTPTLANRGIVPRQLALWHYNKAVQKIRENLKKVKDDKAKTK